MKILFCCTGNTCRSPMAEQLLSSKLNKIGISDIQVDSCGAMCRGGEPMNNFAVAAIKKLGVMPIEHLSKPISRELLDSSDLVICMTHAHRDYLVNLLGENEKIKDINQLLGLGEINDPFGGCLASYELCATVISCMLDKLIIVLSGLNKND